MGLDITIREHQGTDEKGFLKMREPEDDREVICYIENKENSNWNGNRLGSCIDEKWYCKGGRDSHEIVTRWQKIAE